jgi:hypothetical protein
MDIETEFFSGYPQTKPKKCKTCPNTQPDHIIGTWFCGVVIAMRYIQNISTHNAPENWAYHGVDLNLIPEECLKGITKEALLNLPVLSSEGEG